MRKKFLRTMALAVAATLLLTACSSGGGSSAGESSSSAAESYSHQQYGRGFRHHI